MEAIIEHIVTDMGNGAAFCGNCNQILAHSALDIPEICPNCGATLVEAGHMFISPGGSDF